MRWLHARPCDGCFGRVGPRPCSAHQAGRPPLPLPRAPSPTHTPRARAFGPGEPAGRAARVRGIRILLESLPPQPAAAAWARPMGQTPRQWAGPPQRFAQGADAVAKGKCGRESLSASRPVGPPEQAPGPAEGALRSTRVCGEPPADSPGSGRRAWQRGRPVAARARGAAGVCRSWSRGGGRERERVGGRERGPARWRKKGDAVSA